MGVYEGRGRLAKAMKELQLRWQEAQHEWDDPVSHAFEKEHLFPFEMDIRSAITAMDHMAQVLSQAKRDCE